MHLWYLQSFYLYVFYTIPINQIGQSSPMVVSVFLAMSKDAIPPMAFLRWAKYEVGLVKTISIPSANLLSAYAILNPQKSLNIASNLLGYYFFKFKKVG